jgi:S-adenosylmethionine hydrolase
MPGLVTLLTDFGLEDPYVGVMKGVILSRAPGLTLVDLTHQIPPQDVDAASFWLSRAYRWFPEGTVHLVVVDPGVGSLRRAVAVHHAGHFFVGPDNGVFSKLAVTGRQPTAISVVPGRLGLEGISRTFHGRDLFGPVAAELAMGATALDELGPECELSALVGNQAPEVLDGRIRGRVVVQDHFGNLITDIEGRLLAGAQTWRAVIAGRSLRVVGTYAEAAERECVALVGSFGTLEIAVRDSSAAQLLGLTRGESVVVESD